VLSVQRRWKDEHTVVVTNYGGAAATATVGGLPANRTLRRIFPAPEAGDAEPTRVSPDASGTARIRLSAQSVRVYLLE
jgi:hypothetical protein